MFLHGAGKAQSVQRRAMIWVVGDQFPAGQDIFLYSTASLTFLGPTQPPIQWVLGALPSGVKRPVYKVDHRPLFSAKLKKGGALTPLPHTSL
jgi:hypothetical protein